MTLQRDISAALAECGTISHIFSESAKPSDTPKMRAGSPVWRIVNWLTPYTYWRYPGRYAIWHIMTPGYAARTVNQWLTGHKRPPVTVLLHWAELAEAHARAGLEIAAELRAAAAALQARPPHAGTANLRRYRLKKRSTSTL